MKNTTDEIISNNIEESVIYYLVNTTKTFFDDDEDTVDVITGWELVTRSELEDYLKRFKTAEKNYATVPFILNNFSTVYSRTTIVKNIEEILTNSKPIDISYVKCLISIFGWHYGTTPTFEDLVNSFHV